MRQSCVVEICSTAAKPLIGLPKNVRRMEPHLHVEISRLGKQTKNAQYIANTICKKIGAYADSRSQKSFTQKSVNETSYIFHLCILHIIADEQCKKHESPVGQALQVPSCKLWSVSRVCSRPSDVRLRVIERPCTDKLISILYCYRTMLLNSKTKKVQNHDYNSTMCLCTESECYEKQQDKSTFTPSPLE